MQAVSSAVHAALAGNTAPAAALLAKLLGYGVVAGGAVLRVPQIVSIAQHGPSGLQPSMFEAELVGYSLCLAYSVHKGLAFSAYGEQAFVAVQTAVIVALLYRAAPPPPLRAALLWGSYVAVLACYLAGAVPASAIEAGYAFSTLLFWGARVPQLLANRAAKSTGSLSAASTGLQVAGSGARVFTTLQARGGRFMVAAYCVSLFLNAAMLAQIVAYGSGKKGRASGRVRKPGAVAPPKRRAGTKGKSS